MLQEVTCNCLVKTRFVCSITSIIKIDKFFCLQAYVNKLLLPTKNTLKY